MEFWYPIIFTTVVLIVGTVVAIFWWRLAAKASPYQDERARAERKPRDSEDVVIVRTDTTPRL